MTCQGVDAPQARGAQGAEKRLGQVGVDEVGRRAEGGGPALHRDPRGAREVPHHESGDVHQDGREIMNEVACS